MFWDWLLKYSSFLVTGIVSFLVGYLLYKITSKSADLIYYVSQPQWVILPIRQQNQQLNQTVGTFTLFLWNQGKAPAREVHVGHFFLPAHSVYPDIPREAVATPGGGQAIRFPVVPPKTLISICYLLGVVTPVEQVLSYVGSEEGSAKHIPVMLQRIFPKWVQIAVGMLMLAGLWVAVNAAWSLIRFLWVAYYR